MAKGTLVSIFLSDRAIVTIPTVAARDTASQPTLDSACTRDPGTHLARGSRLPSAEYLTSTATPNCADLETLSHLFPAPTRGNANRCAPRETLKDPAAHRALVQTRSARPWTETKTQRGLAEPTADRESPRVRASKYHRESEGEGKAEQ